MKTNPNDSINVVDVKSDGFLHSGLTKREYMATQIFSGFAADPNSSNGQIHIMAEAAVKWADALIESLNAKES